MQLTALSGQQMKGQTNALGVVVAIIMMVIISSVLLYAGLNATSEMADAASIDNTSDFYNTYTNLNTDTQSNFGTVNIAIVIGIFVGVLALLFGLMRFVR